MPRLDFEKQFARQLKDRELKASEGSWEKLQERLDQEKKTSPGYWWMGIAATLIGAFILFNFLGNNLLIDDSPAIVDDSEIENSVEQEDHLDQITVEETDENSETVPLRRGMPLPEVTRESHTAEAIVEGAIAEEPEERRSELNDPPSEVRVAERTAVVSQEKPDELEISDAEINALLEKAVAEVSREMGGEAEVTDAEIDALLASARAAVRQEQALETSTVSASQLLAEVETELEHSFRAQVFEIIKDGLRKTKTAVANIND